MDNIWHFSEKRLVSASFGRLAPEFYTSIAVNCSLVLSFPSSRTSELSGVRNNRIIDVLSGETYPDETWKFLVPRKMKTPETYYEDLAADEMTWGAPVPAFGTQRSGLKPSFDSDSPTWIGSTKASTDIDQSPTRIHDQYLCMELGYWKMYASSCIRKAWFWSAIQCNVTS